MTLTNDEADEAFLYLSETLREAALDWVVTQVEEKLALGKVQTKKLRSRDTPEVTGGMEALRDVQTDVPQKSASAIFSVAEEFTSRERLGVMIDSMKLAVLSTHRIALEAFVNLNSFGVDGRFEFVPEADVAESFSLHAAEVRSRTPAIAKLGVLLDELRAG